jgi:hypothetical protein
MQATAQIEHGGLCRGGCRDRGLHAPSLHPKERRMIRKLKSGEYRLYSRKVDPKRGAAAEKHERAVQFFKRG